MLRPVVVLLCALGLLAAAAPAASARVYVKDPLSKKTKFKPWRLEFRDADMTNLKWKHWGTKVATARGFSSVLECVPNCAVGHRESTATTVKLSRIRTRGGQRRYTCMSWKDDEKVADVPDHGSLDPETFRPCRPPAGAATARAAKANAGRAAKRCKGIELSFTTARVTVEHITCRKGRFVLLEWKRKANEGDGPAPPVLYALGYRCRFGGTDASLKTRCTRGERVAQMRWGG
jgi:hypothetical protein